MLRKAVFEMHGPSRERATRRWQLGVISPMAAVLALVLLAAPMMLRAATAPEMTASTAGTPVVTDSPSPPDMAAPVELGGISPRGVLVDGHRDPHRPGFPSRLPPGIGYR